MLRSDVARPLLLVAALDLVIAVLAFTCFNDAVLGWQACARYSGRVSLLIFALLLIDNTWPQPRHSPVLRALQHGIDRLGPHPFATFAVHHAIHLGFLLTYLMLADQFPPTVRLLGGMLGYALVFVMPLVHWRMQRGSGVSVAVWRRLRIGYFSYLWFVMLMTYVARVFSRDIPFGGERSHYIGLFVLVIALGVISGAVALRSAMGILRRHDDSV